MSDLLPPSTPSRAQVPPAEVPGVNALLTLAVCVVVVCGLYLAREVLIPITLAVLLSFLLVPLVNLLRRIKLGRVLSVLVAVVLALGIILSLGGLIATQIASLAGGLPLYQSTIRHKVETLRGATIGRVSGVLTSLGTQFEQAAQPQSAQPQPGQAGGAAGATPARPGAAGARPAQGTATQEQKPIPVEIQEPQPSPLALLGRIVSPVVGPIETTFIVLIVAIFILLQREDLRDRLIRLFGSGDLHRTTVAMDDAASRLSRYFLTQLAINTGFGVVVGLGLFLIGVPSPVLWGILGALLRFVPYVGTPIAALLPIALAAAVQPGWSMVLWTVGLFAVVEPIVGQAVEPMLYGHSTGLSPVSVVVAAIFWTWLWGPIGLILSTPLTLCLVVMGRHVERLEFLDVLLGDRPALTPAENFYQRILAGDADEVAENAEALLKERPLSSYYDEVALKGLQLAAHDARRGALGRDGVDRIAETLQELVDTLADHDDTDPAPAESDSTIVALPSAERALPKGPAPKGPTPPVPESRAPGWQGETPILCIPGRGPLDEAAAVMLAQLLGKHGLGARIIRHEDVSRARIGQLDVSGVAMVCISYLEIAGNPTYLRYLLRRVRQRLPDVPVLVGLWPTDDPVLRDAATRGTIGAEYFVTSLRQAVEECLEASHRAAQSAGMAQDGSGEPAGAGARPAAPEAAPEVVPEVARTA